MTQHNRTLYPINELQNARLDFVSRWNIAATRDPSVRCLSERHRRFPPTIRVRNCAEYPFTEDEIMWRMPRQPYQADHSLPKRRRLEFDRSRLPRRCADLTDAVLYTEPNTINQEQSRDGHTASIFICDHCPFKSVVRSKAMWHLKQEHHVSCSRYMSITPRDRDDATGDQCQVLCDPRALYNADVPELTWSSDKLAIVCPVCFIVFPDKLMCTYHNQSQHHQLPPTYLFGTVIAVRQVHFTRYLHCDQCQRTFDTPSDYLNHWSTDCPSPFETPSVQPGARALILEAYCHMCCCRFQHAQRLNAPSQSRKRQHKSAHPGSARCLSFGRFVLNHMCCVHMRASSSPCQLSVRFIEVANTSPSILPPYERNNSDRDLLLFCILECKRLISYMSSFKGGIKGLAKPTKQQLNELLAQAEVATFA